MPVIRPLVMEESTLSIKAVASRTGLDRKQAAALLDRGHSLGLLKRAGNGRYRVAKAVEPTLSQLALQVSAPVAAVVNGFGVPPHDGDGRDHFNKIRLANEKGRPYDDVADIKLAKLLMARFKSVYSRLDPKEQKLSSAALGRLLASPQAKLMVGGSIVGHCAGASSGANMLHHLVALVKDNEKSFPAGEAFLRGVRMMGYGAAFNLPPGIRGTQRVGVVADQFGLFNSQSMALAKSASLVEGSHMPNVGDPMKRQGALEIKATDELFRLDPFAQETSSKTPRERRLLAAQRAAERAAKRHSKLGEEQGRLRTLLEREYAETPGRKRFLSSKIAEAVLDGQKLYHAAKAGQRQALAAALKFKRNALYADETLAKRDPKLAASVKAKALRARADALAEARKQGAKAKKAKADTEEKVAELDRSFKSRNSWVNMMRPWAAWAKMWGVGSTDPALVSSSLMPAVEEYKYTHGPAQAERKKNAPRESYIRRSKRNRAESAKVQLGLSYARLAHVQASLDLKKPSMSEDQLLAADMQKQVLQYGLMRAMLQDKFRVLRGSWAKLEPDKKKEVIKALRAEGRMVNRLGRGLKFLMARGELAGEIGKLRKEWPKMRRADREKALARVRGMGKKVHELRRRLPPEMRMKRVAGQGPGAGNR
jgi:hypothetical protein